MFNHSRAMNVRLREYTWVLPPQGPRPPASAELSKLLERLLGTVGELQEQASRAKVDAQHISICE